MEFLNGIDILRHSAQRTSGSRKPRSYFRGQERRSDSDDHTQKYSNERTKMSSCENQHGKKDDGYGSDSTKQRGCSTNMPKRGITCDDYEYSDSDDESIDEFDEDDMKRLEQLSATLTTLSKSITALRHENANLSRLILSACEETLELSGIPHYAKSHAGTLLIARPPTALGARPSKRARCVSIDNKDGRADSSEAKE